MLRIAPEGVREIVLATVLLGGGAWLAIGLGWWPVAVPLAAVWVWCVWFFRDPQRATGLSPGELCAPADGRVTEISRVDHDEDIGGPAIRIGVFLSIFNVHINRSPCRGTVRAVRYMPGRYLDARHPDSGRLNESNTLVIDPVAPTRGPVVVRQVAGKVARRIVCHAAEGAALGAGTRFGMIKFGSRLELIVPRRPVGEVRVRVVWSDVHTGETDTAVLPGEV